MYSGRMFEGENRFFTDKPKRQHISLFSSLTASVLCFERNLYLFKLTRKCVNYEYVMTITRTKYPCKYHGVSFQHVPIISTSQKGFLCIDPY